MFRGGVHDIRLDAAHPEGEHQPVVAIRPFLPADPLLRDELGELDAAALGQPVVGGTTRSA